jgi:hypothetical protein
VRKVWRGFGVSFAVILASMGIAASSASASQHARMGVVSVDYQAVDAKAGDVIPVGGQTLNNGGATGNTRIRVDLTGNGVSAKVGNAKLRVKQGRIQNFQTNAALPSDLDEGSYTLRACAVRNASNKPCASSIKDIKVGKQQQQAPPPASCTSGSHTLGDRNFPEAGNGGIDVQHYDTYLSYNNVGNTLLSTGGPSNLGTHAVLTIKATQDLCDFALDFDGLNITSVKVNGVAAAFSRVAPPGGAPPCTSPTNPCTTTNNSTTLVYPPANGCSPSVNNPPNPSIPGDTSHRGCPNEDLVITPAQAIANNDTFTVDVAYNGVPLRHRDADGTEEGWLNTPNGDGTFNVNEPIGAMTWLPSNNHPADKATYDFYITIPSCSQNATLNPGLPTSPPCFRKTALGNGELLSYIDNPDSTTTWHWRMGYPMATYLAAATIGDFDLTATTTNYGTFFYNALDSTFTAAQKQSANNTIAEETNIVNRENDIFGSFPWDSHGVVADAAGSIGYVLEVQGKIHFPSSSIGLGTLAHETSHQWFGDSVSLKNWNEIWLNEGWATYSANWYSAKYSTGASLDSIFTGQYTPGGGACPGNNKWCVAPHDVDAANEFSTFPVYTRGGTMLISLQKILGDTKFYNLSRKWQATYKYGNATTQDFINMAKDIASQPAGTSRGFDACQVNTLDQFFQQWLFGHTQPTISHLNFFTLCP